MANKTESGKDGVLIVEGREVPFASVSEDISFDTSEVDSNDALNNAQAYVSKSAELSIEADGSKTELKSLLLNSDGTPKEGLVAEITGPEGGDRFTEGRITGFGREFPASDLTSTEIDLTFDSHRPLDLGA
jgi:hypothetical protein